MEAGTFGLALLVEASVFPSDIHFLFGADPEGLSVTGLGASLGDFLGEGETFTHEGLCCGLLRMAR